MEITWGDKTITCEEGTTLFDISKQVEKEYEFPIIVAKVDGVIQELYHEVTDGTTVSFCTTKDSDGKRAYIRGMSMLLLKAIQEEKAFKEEDRITIDFCLDSGYYCHLNSKEKPTKELLNRLEKRMREDVKKDIRFEKVVMRTRDARRMFEKKHMSDKSNLLKYRRNSRMTVYHLGDFTDYYYGYMAPDTSYIRWFDLVPYEYGFVLLLPTKEQPQQVPELKSSKKLFDTLKESAVWGEKMGISTIADLNSQICKGRASELILIQEALQEKKIGQIAEMIAAQPEKKFVMIAGPSSSGKTTFSHRLSIQLKAKGLKPHPIAVDNYFVNRVDSPKDEHGNYNYEVLECLDTALFNQNMTDLLAGKTVELPEYNFIKGEREYHGDYLTLGPDDVLVIEGIHCLNEKLSYALPRKNKFKIYISALTQLNIDEHNRIPTTDGRLLRRIVRDARTRGASAQDTIRMWPSVRRGEEENIFPYQEDADVMFNSALVYELSVLKQYAEPVLFSVPRDSAEYVEAKRLLKFLDYFLGVSSEEIPHNSLIREFIGGSCFKV